MPSQTGVWEGGVMIRTQRADIVLPFYLSYDCLGRRGNDKDVKRTFLGKEKSIDLKVRCNEAKTNKESFYHWAHGAHDIERA